MKPNITLLRRTCKQAAALLIAREDRALNLPDHIALKLHLMACQACPKFENQVLSMREAMGRWRHYGGEAEKAASAGSSDRPAE